MRIALYRALLAAALALAYVGGAGTPAWAGKGKKESVEIKDLAPLQADAGFALAHYRAELWIAEAKAEARSNETSVRKELIKIMNREGGAGFDAYISPDGKIRPNDGHHKVLAALEVMRRYRIASNYVRWKVVIQEDYSRKDSSEDTWQAFGTKLGELGVGPPEFLEAIRANPEKAGELIRAFPSRFQDLKNSPMRSAVGMLFERLGIKGSMFTPYVQFVLGKRLRALGFRLPPGQELKPGLQARLLWTLLKGGHAQELQKILITSARKEKEQRVSEAIQLAGEAADKKRGTCLLKAIAALSKP